MVARVALVALGLSLAACATAGAVDETPEEVVDGGKPKSDASATDAGGCPKGKAGPGCSLCAGGYHACGGSNCMPDQPNLPDAGCSNGCGTPCAPPAHGSSTCTTAGQCDFECASTYTKGDAGCECASGMLACSDGTCAQCCSDTDCPAHTTCNGGSCGGCVPNWADCNNKSSDGCETSLSSEPNCGKCGHSCSGYPACGVLTFHGESCKSSGGGYACKC